MPVCALADVNIHYELTGPDDAPAVVLAHGFCTSTQMWARLVPPLSNRYRVINYDARGHGLSTAPAGAENYRLKLMAQDLRGLLSHLEVERADIAGHSMGGAAALAFAAEYPDMSRSLLICNIDGGHQPPNAEEEAQRASQHERSHAIVRKRGLVDYARRIIERDMAPRFVLDDPAAVTAFIDRYARQPQNGFFGAGLARPWTEPWLKEASAAIELPMAIIAGDEDQHYAGAARLHAAQPDSFFATIEGAPHDSMNARPDAFNRAFLDYLASIEAAAPLSGPRSY